jgi:regulator of protease activity HflC (stomatin/prohibitin superfamily)
MFWYVLSAIAIFVFYIAMRIARVRLVRVTVYEFQRALRYRKGRFLSVLGPGQYWILEPGTTITPVDVRPNFVTLMGQEVLTADGVPLKVSIAANYEMSDPQLAINGQANYAQALYLLLQLAVREVISASKADELMENRAGFAEKIRALAEPQVQKLGLKLLTADLKDLMISGDLKKSFAQVVRARKEGEAALERARGETAALRSLANAARMLQDNPQLMQLRMLQAMGESAGNTLVVGLPSGSTPLPVRGERGKSSNEKGADDM